ncbi:MAG: hypothetical protein KDD62_10370, partial [Bdellovibrionales bacterium]|nr:hypothetical protein [Bdellovibrionales bacterium]
GMLGGCALGVTALAWTPEKMLEILLLLSILFFLVKRRFLPTAQFPKLGHAKWASAIGGLSGFVQGTTGTGGPLLIMYVSACLP